MLSKKATLPTVIIIISVLGLVLGLIITNPMNKLNSNNTTEHDIINIGYSILNYSLQYHINTNLTDTMWDDFFWADLDIVIEDKTVYFYEEYTGLIEYGELYKSDEFSPFYSYNRTYAIDQDNPFSTTKFQWWAWWVDFNKFYANDTIGGYKLNASIRPLMKITRRGAPFHIFESEIDYFYQLPLFFKILKDETVDKFTNGTTITSTTMRLNSSTYLLLNNVQMTRAIELLYNSESILKEVNGYIRYESFPNQYYVLQWKISKW